MNNLREKLLALSGGQTSDWKAKVKNRRENHEWLKKSALIALAVLEAMEAQELSQKDLAEKMGVSPQHINKVVSGQENLTLETITKLETTLGITIIVFTESKGKLHTGRKGSAA